MVERFTEPDTFLPKREAFRKLALFCQCPSQPRVRKHAGEARHAETVASQTASELFSEGSQKMLCLLVLT